MRKIIYGILLIGFLHLSYGIFISQWTFDAFEPQAPSKATEQQLFYDYAGVIDVHSNKSTGSGDLESISRAAQLNHLDFVVLNEMNDFKPDLTQERYYDRVLMFLGGEYSYLDSHILNFDLRTTDHLEGPGRSQVVFADLLNSKNRNRDAGLIVLAHPYKQGYRWAGEYPPGLDGIEVYNLKSLWQEHWLRSKRAFFWSLTIFPYNSTLAFLRLFTDSGPAREVELWDKLNIKQPTLGFAGTDADARIHLWGDSYLPIPSYDTLFSIVKNHVLIRSELTGQAPADKAKISEAIRHGQFYFSLDILENPHGFTAYATRPDHTIIPLGSEVAFTNDLNFVINIPERPQVPFETEIYKDGEKFFSSTSLKTEYTIHGPGVYRAKVRLKASLPWPDGHKWIDWILTNPIYVR